MYAQLLSAGSDPGPTKGLLFRKGYIFGTEIRTSLNRKDATLLSPGHVCFRQLKELQTERRERLKIEMDDAIRLRKTAEMKGFSADFFFFFFLPDIPFRF